MRAATIARSAVLAAALAAAGAVHAAAELEEFDARTPAALRAAHAGKPFVLVFWSTTCAPCREELPRWVERARRHPGIPIHLVLVPLGGGGEAEEARRILDDLGAVGVRAAVAWDDVPERLFHAVDPGWRGELPAAWFFDGAHRAERRLGRADASWVDAWMEARAGAVERRP